MEPNRKLWNEQQQALQRALERPAEYPQAIALCLSQHAMVHAAVMSQAGLWSFEDEVLQEMSEGAVRCIPQSLEHSVAWILWHLARIEDVTMNLLMADCPQVLNEDGWLVRTRSTIAHTGNAMDAADVVTLSAALDIEALRAYRIAVGRRTREIVQQLQPEDLKQKVSPARIDRVRAEGAVLEAASGIITYWSTRTIAGLLLMPATRHNFLHLNEALRLKQKCRREFKAGAAVPLS